MKNASAIVAATLLVLVGCGGPEPEDQPQPSATTGAEQPQAMGGMHGMHGGQGQMHGMHGMQGGGAAACPMLLTGADMSVEEIDGGAAMTFTTDRAEELEDLRARVRAMAAMHEQRAATRPGRGMRAMPPADVSVTDLPNGARVELRATDAADVDALRSHVAMQADHMQSRRTCPMMEAAPA